MCETSCESVWATSFRAQTRERRLECKKETSTWKFRTLPRRKNRGERVFLATEVVKNVPDFLPRFKLCKLHQALVAQLHPTSSTEPRMGQPGRSHHPPIIIAGPVGAAPLAKMLHWGPCVLLKEKPHIPWRADGLLMSVPLISPAAFSYCSRAIMLVISVSSFYFQSCEKEETEMSS